MEQEEQKLTIIELNGEKWIGAIELHKKAFEGRRYSNFVTDYLTKNELVKEGVEFVTIGLQTSGKGGGRPVTEYYLTYDYAKEVFATIRTPKGREYLKYLIRLEKDKLEGRSHSDEQVLMLIHLKEVFKYLSTQKEVYDIHKKNFVDEMAFQNKTYPKHEYHVCFGDMRNEILKCSKRVIDERLRQYCAENGRVAKSRNVNDALALLDKYETLRNAVWDFLTIKGNPNALHLADLVKRMIEAENGAVWRVNESDMFHQKELLMPVKKLLAQ